MDRAAHRRTAANNPSRRFGFFVRWTLRSIPVFLVLWLLGWASIGDSMKYIGYVHSGGFLFGLLAILTALLLAFRRDFIWAAAAALLGAGILSFGGGLNFSAGNTAKQAGMVRIVSASLRGRNTQMEAAAERLASYNPDIIVAQEVNDIEALSAALDTVTGVKWHMVSKGRLASFARHKIEIAKAQSKDSVLKTHVHMPDGVMSVWNIRAPKNYMRPAFNAAFFAELSNHARSENPDVIAGDYNATQWNAGYYATNQYMKSAHADAGFWQGNSFPARGRLSGLFGAFARIDHIFVNSQVDVHNAFTGTASVNADHHPVIADIRLIENRN